MEAFADARARTPASWEELLARVGLVAK